MTPRNVLSMTVLAGLALLPAAAAAQTDTLPIVVTTGEGIVRRAPDRATVSAAVESRAKSPKDAQQQTAATMTAVQERLRQAGVQKDALRTLAVNLQLEYDFVNGKRVARGYLARNVIEVRIDEIARAGEIIDAAVSAGATSVSGIRFDLRDRDAAEREALKLAVADARARADAAAAGAGRTIDRIVKIEEQRGLAGPPPIPMLRTAAEQAMPDTPVSEGLVEIRAQVLLTAVLK